MLKIHMYGILWNEAPMLPYFFRHYDQYVERYVLYDDGSDDGSLELLAAHPRVECRTFAAENESVCETGRILKSSAWKESRHDADLVLVCDVDEFVCHPDLHGFLDEAMAREVTIFRPSGWEMVADRFPDTTGQIYDEVRRGTPSREYSKPCLFRPDCIEEINYSTGCHRATPSGQVCWEKNPELKLLHFKYLGPQYVISRYRELQARLGRRDRENGWGRQYGLSASRITEMFASLTPCDVWPSGDQEP